MAEALRFADVAAGYGRRAVVSGVSLTVSAGEILGLVGPNAAGKTTLLRTVTGDAAVLSGALTLEGRPRGSFSSAEMARMVAVLPQTQPQTFAFTVRDFVTLGRHAHLRRLADPGAADRALVERMLALTDTLRLAEVRVDTLSGGDLQRATLAQALVQEPRVLLLDEPTSHLDIDHTLMVLDLVRSLAGQGLAVLAVFHDLGLASRYADRLAVVAGGELRAVGRPAEVLTPQLVGDVFRVRAVVGTDVVTGAVSVTPVLRDESLSAGRRGPRVLVISGASTGALLLRSLVLAGYDVTCGALNRGDTDQAVAEALGVPRVDLPAFGSVDEKAFRKVERLASEAEAIVVGATPFGTSNLANLRAAVESDKPLVVVETDEERDFAHGEARRYLARAKQRGAVSVKDGEAALQVLGRMLGR
ncbi:MAG TPA: ABC transporter ATP-binding protein [Coriobacteriia bacterium]|jgi:iron complex transport system ATP-binding protein